MSRSRRALLSTLGLTLGAGVAGCLGDGTGDDPHTRTDTADGTTSIGSPTSTGTGTAELVDHSFETSGGTDPAGTDESASIDWGGSSAVVVDGRVTHPSIPADARLAVLEYDADAGTLEIRVVSFSPTPTGEKTATAMPAYTAVDYRVTARFTGGLPARVEVYHSLDEGAEPVLVDAAAD